MYGERENDNVHARTLLTRVDSGARCAGEGKEKEQVAKRDAFIRDLSMYDCVSLCTRLGKRARVPHTESMYGWRTHLCCTC